MPKLVLLVISFMLAGCHPMWARQSLVAPSRAAFPQCVSVAVSNLPELEVVGEYSTPGSVFLPAKKYAFYSVTSLPDSTLRVEAKGGGFSPSAEQAEYSMPLLAALATRLAQEC